MKQKGCGKSGWGKIDVIRDFEREEGKGADMAVKAVQQIQLGTVMGTEEQALKTMRLM